MGGGLGVSGLVGGEEPSPKILHSSEHLYGSANATASCLDCKTPNRSLLTFPLDSVLSK